MEDVLQPSESALLKEKKIKRDKTIRIVKKSLLYALLVLIAVYMILPFYWSLLISFRPKAEIEKVPIILYPNSFTWDNYARFFEEGVFQYIGNTLFVIVFILFFQLLFCCMGGYALAKFKLPFKKKIVKFFYASMMVPGIISLIPQYIVVQALGLTGSLWGIIVPSMYSIYGCLFMRSFFMSTPSEVAEAARIDGAGEFRIFLQLFIPMVMPGLITLALFTFNGNWNNFLWPSLVAPDREVWVMAVAIKEFEGLYGIEQQGAVMAGAIVTVIPSVLIFLVGQKYFMDNLTFAGIK